MTRVKAIAVIIASIALANVRLRVPFLEMLGTSVLTAARAAHSILTASRGAIRIFLARVILTGFLI